MIRLTSFPILLLIALYERQAKRSGSLTFYETVSSAAEKVLDTLPRSLKRLCKYSFALPVSLDRQLSCEQRSLRDWQERMPTSTRYVPTHLTQRHSRLKLTAASPPDIRDRRRVRRRGRQRVGHGRPRRGGDPTDGHARPPTIERLPPSALHLRLQHPQPALALAQQRHQQHQHQRFPSRLTP